MNSGGEPDDKPPMTAAEFLLACKARGLSIAEIDEMNLGLVVDFIYAYDDMHDISENEEYLSDSGTVMATQADFDKF